MQTFSDLFRLASKFAASLGAATACASCASMPAMLAQVRRTNVDMQKAQTYQYDGSGIVNGHDVPATSPDANLAVLLLTTRGSSLNACTGVLIKKRIILTAAHCVNGVEPKNVRVVFKTIGNPTTAGPTDLKAEKIQIHEKFDGKPENFSDLALVKLAADAPSSYHPVALASAREKIKDDAITLIGYGITGEDKKDSMTLRETKKSYKDDIHLKDGYFGIDQKNASGGFCRGDSGAPVFVSIDGTKKLLGINSFTVGIEENKECHTASVAMPSSHFQSWIDTNAKRL